MPTDTRMDTVTALGPRGAPTATHHHTAPLRADHVTVVIAVGALLWLLGMAFVVSWRSSGDRLRAILNEFHNN